MAQARQLTSSASLKGKEFTLAGTSVPPRENGNQNHPVWKGTIMTTGSLLRQEIEIANQLGLHARPAAEFVRASKAFRSQIWIVKGDERFSAASIMEVLTANLNCGDRAIIEADGPDAKEAVEKLAQLVRDFGRLDSDKTKDNVRITEDDF